MNLLLIHGPNFNLLGTREPEKYGKDSLQEFEQKLIDYAQKKKVDLECFQSNFEGEIVEKIHSAKQTQKQGLILNMGAYTHTSIAIRDAVLAVNIPCYEVHVSNVFAREKFRHQSMLADIARGVIAGLGVYGYHAAISAFINSLK